jgi:hypothetical protein
VRIGHSPAKLMDTLLHAAGSADGGRIDRDAMAGVPPPVTRYLSRVLRNGQPLIRVARLRQKGLLRPGLGNSRWMSFESRQVVTPLSAGFIWDARVRIIGPLHLRVVDSYVLGHGSGQLSLQSAIPLAHDGGRRELNSGALHRYLAEAVWYPTALLPSPVLRWSPIDQHRALATLADAGQKVALEFRFTEAGEVSGIYTPARWEKTGDGYRQTPWEGHFHNYIEREGMTVPSEGEVGWYVHDQWRKVWTGSIVEAAYEFVG